MMCPDQQLHWHSTQYERRFHQITVTVEPFQDGHHWGSNICLL